MAILRPLGPQFRCVASSAAPLPPNRTRDAKARTDPATSAMTWPTVRPGRSAARPGGDDGPGRAGTPEGPGGADARGTPGSVTPGPPPCARSVAMCVPPRAEARQLPALGVGPKVTAGGTLLIKPLTWTCCGGRGGSSTTRRARSAPTGVPAVHAGGRPVVPGPRARRGHPAGHRPGGWTPARIVSVVTGGVMVVASLGRLAAGGAARLSYTRSPPRLHRADMTVACT
jgi:hypothetical protein